MIFYFSRCGFNNILSLQSITDEEINEVERIVREETLDFVAKKMQYKLDCSADILLHEDQLVEYFGETYASSPTNFRFEIGDRKLIKILRDHAKCQFEKGKNGMSRYRKKCSRTKRTKFEEIDRIKKSDSNLNEFLLKEGKGNNYCEDLSQQLVQRLKQYLESFGIEKVIVRNVNSSNVCVKMVNGKVHAEVFCIICQENQTTKRELKGKKVFYMERENGGSKFWVLSNYGQHLKNKHKLHSSKSSRHPLTDTDTNDFAQEIVSNDTNTNCDVQNTFEIRSYSTKASNYESTDLHAENVLEKSFEVVEYDDPSSSITLENVVQFESNQHKFMFDQVSTQITKMIETTLSNNEKHTELYSQLTDSNRQCLKIVAIAKDGNCLFSSLAHQLFGHKIKSSEHKEATKKLRKDVVDHIIANYSSFQLDLRTRVYETVDQAAIKDMNTECLFILNHCLTKSGFWGGSETMKAVHELYHVNILIFNENGICHFFNQWNDSNDRTVILAYRLAHTKKNEAADSHNHYDSVCDMSSEEMYNSTLFLFNTLNKKNTVFDETL